MSEKSDRQSSQAQQQVASPWQRAAEAQTVRIRAFYDQLAQYEAEGAERAQKAIDELARLTKEAIEHGARLGSEWRRLSLEAMRRSTDLAT